MTNAPILVLNSGSSSLKFGLYSESEGGEAVILDGLAQSLGRTDGTLEVKDAHGEVVHSERSGALTSAQALQRAAGLLAKFHPGDPQIIGHRVVHGGPRLIEHQPITTEVLEELKRCVHLAPLHIPPALELIDAVRKRYPNVPQFACFDTAFHRTMPERAARFALPRELYDEGVRRYGFHGLSYESIVYQLRGRVPERMVIAHLGNGASLAALKNGASVDTTMGLTPSGGIPMATRTGDIDPGVLIYLQRAKKWDADTIERVVNRESGLFALSGGKSDMREIQKAAAGDANAQLAFEVFCLAIAKVVAAYAAELGGLDALVFSGGIGEHSAPVRANVCTSLAFLGVVIDAASNEKNAPVISANQSKIRVS